MGKRMRAQRRGVSPAYRSPERRSEKHVTLPKMERGVGIVEDIEHECARSAPVARVRFENGQSLPMLAPEGICVGQEIRVGKDAPLRIGNILPLSKIPSGLPVFNIEQNPRDGGKFVKAAGSAAVVVSQGSKVVVQLPSGKFKSFMPECRAILGVAASGGRRERPVMKAGKKYYYLQSKSKCWPRVKGVAMNAVDHPHGGGGHRHVGKSTNVSKHTHPGRKVGMIAPKKKGRRNKK